MSSSDLLNNLKREREILIKRLQSINDLISDYEGSNTNNRSADHKGELSIPDKYNPGMTWKEKVFFLLNAIGGKGTVTEMFEELKRKDNKAGTGVKEILTQIASNLYNKQIIDAETKNKPYVYRLKP